MDQFSNGTKALDVFGGCRHILQPEPSPHKIDIEKVVGRSTGVGYHRLRGEIKKYKFYLAFENSMCNYYITEKFFDNGFLSGAVPIAVGSSRKFYEELAPGLRCVQYNTTQEI